MQVTAMRRNPAGFQTITGLSTSTAQALTVPQGAAACLIQAEVGQVRMALGTNPTSTPGIRLDDGQLMFVDSDPASVRLIAVSTANVQIQYFDK